ncbi:MAG: hypothetical protein KF763_20950 [Cyclobacteriaceae bacterium]|nr:hypothetical protein [Cyclobacteriaceae bacterium]
MTESDFDEKDKMLILKIIGLGLFLVIGVAVLYNYFRNNEYPELRKEQVFTKEWIHNVDVDRGLCFVELQNGMKFRAWAENLNYENYYSLATILSSRALLSKNLNSDTLTVTYLGDEYKYILGQVITKD